ncbi:MAG: hypothetical protein CXR31_14475 [Geobacter sp.]|nr:MAG: hypothetical protein CXR31_14475 [Geobacter sp.]
MLRFFSLRKLMLSFRIETSRIPDNDQTKVFYQIDSGLSAPPLKQRWQWTPLKVSWLPLARPVAMELDANFCIR